MAWIEDSVQNVLLVRQAGGLKLWTLPGGKVKPGESLVKALKREVYEGSGLRVQISSLLGVLDRRDKDAITLLFAALSNKQSVNVKQTQKEIKKRAQLKAWLSEAGFEGLEIRVRHWSREFVQADAIQGELMITLHRQM